MELEIIYPHVDDKLILEDNYIYFKNKKIPTFVIGKLDETTYKVVVGEYVCGLVHDGRYCAFDRWQENFLFHQDGLVDLLILPKHNSLYAQVSKNGCSTVESEVYNHFYRKFWEPKIKSNELIWERKGFRKYRTKSHILMTKYLQTRDERKFQTVFTTYDDPVKRFVRVLNYKYTESTMVLSSYKPPYDVNVDDFISKCILLTRLNLLNVVKLDQHITPISLTHEPILDDITDFVYLKDLDKFMSEKFNIEPKRYNTTGKKNVTLDSLSEEHLKQINKIYKEDFLIPEKYADKFFKC